MTPQQPGLYLVLGLPGAGKGGVVMRWLADARSQGPLLVVPTRPDVQAYGLELTKAAGPLFGPFAICTFDELVARVAGGRRRALGALGRSLLAGGLVREQGLRTLSRVAAFPGTVGALSAVLDQLEEGAARPEEAQRRLARWAEACPEDAPLALDLAAVLERRREMMASIGAADRMEVWRAAAAAARHFTLPVAVHGFAGFAPQERRLLLALSEAVPVLVSLPYEKDRAATAALRAEVEGLRATAREVTVVPYDGESGGPAWRRRLIEGFLSVDDATLTGVEEEQESGVTVALASGRRTEAELAAAEVVRLLRAGFAPEDIVVLVGRVGRWRRLLAQVLCAAGIPFSVDAEMPLGETGLGHALVEGVAAVLGGEARGLFSYLHSPYAGVSLEVADQLESAFHRSHGRKWERLLPAARHMAPGALEEIEGVLRPGLEGGFELDPQALSGLARRMLVRAARGHGLHSFELKEDAKALSALGVATEELQEWGARPSGERPWWGDAAPAAEMLRALAGLPVHLGEDGGQVVRVMSAHRSLARTVRAVLLLGLVEGEFPEAGDGSVLVSSQQRARAAAACGADLFPTVDPSRDALAFLLVASRAGESLYVSSRDAEEDGGPVSVSPFWEGVDALFPYARRPYRGLDEVVPGPADAGFRRDYLRACALAGLRPPAAEDSLRLDARAPWYRGPARLSAAVVARSLSGRTSFSASELEDYCRCPFAWFIGDALRIEEMEIEFGVAGKGTLAHRVLAAVYAALGQEGLLPLRQESLSRAFGLAGLHLDQELEALSGQGAEEDRVAALWLVKDQVRRLLEFDAAACATVVPLGFELDLGREGGAPDLGGFAVTGRIDRLDVDTRHGVALVVDYKSGSVPNSASLAQQGRLQLPLYLLALRAARPGTEFAGGVFYSLSSGEVRGLVQKPLAGLLGGWAPKSACVDVERFEQELADCRALAEEAVAGLRAGTIGTRPRGGECPRWCGLRPVCRGPERKGRS